MAILVVDDVDINSILLTKMLASAGHQKIQTAASGREALVALNFDNDEPVDIELILLDVIMNDINGIEVCRKLRKDRRYDNVPIIMVTAQNEEEDLALAFEAGANDYITRPVRKLELLSRVKSALRLRDERERRQQREAELQESEDRIKQLFQATFKSTKEGIILHTESIIIDANESISSLLGYDMIEMIGTDALFFLEKEEARRVRQLTENNPGVAVETVATSREKKKIPIEVSCKIIPYQGQEVKVTNIRDISERKAAEEALNIKARRQAALAEIGQKALEKLDLDALHSNIIELLVEMLKVKDVCIWEFDIAKQQMKLVDSFGHKHLQGKIVPLEEKGLHWLNSHSYGPVIVEDKIQKEIMPEEMVLNNTGAIVTTPIGQISTLYGIIGICSNTAQEFDNDDISFLQSVSLMLAYTINRKRSEAALAASEERYSIAMRGANDGIWDWDLVTEKVYFSDRWKHMLGYEVDEINDDIQEWFGRVHEEDLPRLRAQIDTYKNSGTEHFESEFRIQLKDGSYRWFLSRGIALREGKTNTAYRMAGSQTDIHDRKRAEEQLLHDAFHDALTGMPNRALFLDRVGRAIERCQQDKNSRYVVLYLDLDRFKIINDSMGHHQGDELLKQVSKRIAEAVHPGDTVARFGGDEFSILSENFNDLSDIYRFVENIKAAVAKPYEINGQELVTSASVGIAVSETGYRNATEVLRDADIAMYRAKNEGRGSHVVFDKAMFNRAAEILQLEANLRKAVEEQQLVVHYQPIINLKEKKISGFEALIRWEHPTRGTIPPGQFIPVAEESGLIIPIGAFVFEQACFQARKFIEQGNEDIQIAVNVSAIQFKDSGFLEVVESAIEKSEIEPRHIKIEITESLAMTDVDYTIMMLTKIGRLGIEISVDDFGTGYSSLSYLKKFPINTLKIDQSFVKGVDLDDDDAAIIDAIIAISASLNFSVVAEGVESKEELDFLKKRKCDYVQGYYFSKPLNAIQAEEYLSKNQNSLEL